MSEPTADHVSLAAGLDAPGVQAAPHDPDAPLGDLHESHEFVAYDRWCECSTCGVRDYWPGAVEACPGIAYLDRKGRKVPPAPVTLDEAVANIRAGLEQFGTWWEQKEGLPAALPTMDDWVANWCEWHYGRGEPL